MRAGRSMGLEQTQAKGKPGVHLFNSMRRQLTDEVLGQILSGCVAVLATCRLYTVCKITVEATMFGKRRSKQERLEQMAETVGILLGEDERGSLLSFAA